MNKRKVLFLSPFCSMNGAEMMINNIINLIKEKISACYFFEHKGGLYNEIKVKSYYLNNRSFSYFFNYLVNFIFKTNFSAKEKYLKKIDKINNFDIWYVHTIHMLWTVDLAKALNKKVIIHLHDYLYQYQSIHSEEFKKAIEYAEIVITCAEFIKKDISNFNVKKCIVVNECVDFERVERLLQNDFNPNQEFLKKEFFLMSGTYNYRKGIDLFIEIARKNAGYNFVCVGGGNSAFKEVLRQKIISDNISNVFLLDTKNKTYYHLFAYCKGFILSSREDPFPLVMIEAAYFGKPIFGFKSGGISEFLLPEMGRITQNFLTSQLSKSINTYNFDAHDENKSKARAMEFDGKMQAKLILESINAVV